MSDPGQLGLDLAAADPGPLRPVDDTYVRLGRWLWSGGP